LDVIVVFPEVDFCNTSLGYVVADDMSTERVAILAIQRHHRRLTAPQRDARGRRARGFEKFCEGRMFFEMPQITERICGICPVSHHLVSVKACDQILGVTAPRPAQLLRELMHMGQTIQSHSMHFFELAGPDLLLGFDADPAIRNVAGLYAANPELVGKAIALRKYGQSLISTLGDRRIHPNFAVPGGVNKARDVDDRDALLAEIPTMIGYVQEALAIIKDWADHHRAVLEEFAVFPSG